MAFRDRPGVYQKIDGGRIDPFTVDQTTQGRESELIGRAVAHVGAAEPELAHRRCLAVEQPARFQFLQLDKRSRHLVSDARDANRFTHAAELITACRERGAGGNCIQYFPRVCSRPQVETEMPNHNRDRFHQWLDAADVAATTVYILLMAVIVGCVLGALFYLYTHWPKGYGLGPQGEGLYLGVAILLVLGWVMAQFAWLIRRRRRNAWTFEDGSEIPIPKIDVGDTGVSIQWGQPPDASVPAAGSRTWSWNIPMSSAPLRTFRLNQETLDAARQARASGASWEDVCRRLNPDWDSMNALDRALYQRAVEAAVNTH